MHGTSITHFDWANFCLAALSLTFRGYEAGLFHAYWVISSCSLCFLQMFSDRIWSQCSPPLNDFHLPLFKPYALLLRLNNLSFFNWFSLKYLDPKSYMRVVFWGAMNIMIFWFVLTLELSARLQNTQQCICIGNLVDKFTSKFWPHKKALKVRTAHTWSFTVNEPCHATPFCE